jgi:hypothetical protein
MVVAHATTVPLMPRSGLPKQPSRGYRLRVRRSLPAIPLTLAFEETPVTGRDDNERAWSGYFEAFPTYLILPHQIAQAPGGEVAVLGHTTGSHLGWRTARNHYSP